MKKIQQFIENYRSWRDEFTPYNVQENGLVRLILIHFFAAVVISPIYTILIINFGAPEAYFYIGLSYTVLFPVYALICWNIKFFNDKLLNFFVIHLFAITLLGYESLIKNGFQINELFCFFGLYAICVIVINRWYPLVLYNLFVLLLILYGIQFLGDISTTFELVGIQFITVGISGSLILFTRMRMIMNMEDYSDYLKKIMNSSGSGYLLFDLSKENKIIDFNTEVGRILNIKNKGTQEIKKTFFKYINKGDLAEIKALKNGKFYKKNITREKFGIIYFIEISFTIMSLKNNKYWLATINDISEEKNKRDELELNEKKYRNLYYRNKAGVFTIDKNSVIIDGNYSFFEMFEETIDIGDRLFTIDNQDDWDLIIESFGEKESAQNYQTQFILKNGNEKTFIFSWYLDTQTNKIEGSVIDLTDTQRTSQALKQSEEKYRLIFEETNDAILFLDGDKIIDVNRKAIQLFGLPQQALLSTNLFELSSHTDKTSKEQYDDVKIKNANSRSAKFNWMFIANNKTIEAEVTFIEITLGSKLFYQCVIHDCTEQNNHLRAISKNQRNLQNILENNPEGILIVKNRKILYSNPEINKLLGDVEYATLFSKKDQVLFDNKYSDHLIDGSLQSIQLNQKNKNGDKILVDVTFVATTYEEEDATLIIIRDVSIQNYLAKEKLRAELAEESNKQLAGEIMERINAEKLLEEQYLRTRAILDSSSNTFLLTLTLDGKISTFNKHSKSYFSTILQQNIEEGIYFNDYFKSVLSDLRLRLFHRYINSVKKGNSRQFEVNFEINEREYWLEIFMNPIFDINGNVAEISMVAHDINEKKKTSIEIVESLKEKEVLLKEIHHRVKNNLQVISSILNLQSSFVTDKKTLEILQESRNRIRTMAIIHENLYRTKDFSSINFSNYIDNLTINLISTYRVKGEIELKNNLNNVDLVLDQAIPCGLIVNELITNSLKYAWGDHELGIISINLEEKDNFVILEISDNGRGLPDNFDISTTETLGLQLVETLVDQLDGDIMIDNKSGTKYLIKFEKTKP